VSRPREYVRVTVMEVLRETPKAFWCRVKHRESGYVERWMAKSQLRDPSALSVGLEDVEVDFAYWLALECELAFPAGRS